MLRNKEDIKKEALERMRILDIYDDALEYFEQKGEVLCSFRTNVMGKIVGVVDRLNAEQRKRVDEVKGKYPEYFVYHITHTNTTFGELLNLLVIPNDNDTWERDKNDLREDGYCFSLCINMSSDDIDHGYINVNKASGGIIRVN